MKTNPNPSRQDVRRFAWTWMLASACLGGLVYWRQHAPEARGIWAASFTVGFLGAAWPSAARLFYRAWMGLAFGINEIVTKLLLALIFWGVLTPMAILFRIGRRDALHLKRSGTEVSYWNPHDRTPDASSYRHLY